MEKLNVVFLSLGSNLGEREKHITQALHDLSERGVQLVSTSSYFYSEPVGFDSKHQFCNCCVKVLTSLDPFSLLHVIREIEAQNGRLVKSKNGIYADRTIDIDIIFFNQLELVTDQLTVPHPAWATRPFVYFPLIELVHQ